MTRIDLGLCGPMPKLAFHWSDGAIIDVRNLHHTFQLWLVLTQFVITTGQSFQLWLVLTLFTFYHFSQKNKKIKHFLLLHLTLHVILVLVNGSNYQSITCLLLSPSHFVCPLFHFGMSQNIILFLKIKVINLLIFLLYPY